MQKPTKQMIENEEKPSPKLDAWFAELVMGWRQRIGKELYIGFDEFWWVNLRNEGIYIVEDFRPSTNIAHAMEGENLIKEPKDRYRYTKCLDEIVNHDRGKPFEYDYLFDLIHATAHQRTRALLLWAIEKDK